jgi:DNA-binding NarL/FixJ family response regulator
MIKTIPESSQPIPTVIVSRPGIMLQSLRASLAACPGIAVVASFGDGLTALNRLAGLQHGILVIDSNLLDEEVDALLGAVKVRQPGIRCLVVAQSRLRHQQLLVDGADAVILRNGSAHDLQQALSRLVQDSIDPRA